ncbi:Box C/D snoRNA protein 1 [Portunus trituberculatus]|uniref:Box C/D snoRNA protein 1 n=2 Tax=Portunus trituberculatus TaxID=210409 RepID=A0A5B7DAW8_PORTR|nr:Box C/D snoRNA protein 1 [Portunus trituberculatus]
MLRSAKKPPDDRLSVPPHLQQLRIQAAQRGTTLKFIPSFFSNHRENTTRYHFKEGVIRWHIKWVFHQADVVLIDCSVDENTLICTLLAKYMNPTKNELSAEDNEKLAYYHSASYSRVSVLMKTNTPDSGVVFHEIEPLKTLRVNFANKVILEYPVLYVVLKDHLCSYLDYHGEDEGHDDLFSVIEEKEEQGKNVLNFFDGDCDVEPE